MTDYNAILDTQIEPDAPLTSQLGSQFRDNPIAIAEGSSGAPKIAGKNLFAAGLGTFRFANLQTFGGARFIIHGVNTNIDDPRGMFINASDPVGDGTERTIATIAANGRFSMSGRWIRETGAFTIVGTTGTTSFQTTDTMTKTGADVDELIFITTANIVGIHVMPDGGETVT